jgi:hypothetical protein
MVKIEQRVRFSEVLKESMWIDLPDNMNAVCVERVQSSMPREVARGTAHEYRTSNADWQAITHLIAAAPTLLAACKQMVQAFDEGDADAEQAGLRALCDAIAKSEPPRVVPVKRKVTVTTEVEVEVFSDAPDDAVLKFAEIAVRSGSGNVTRKSVIA